MAKKITEFKNPITAGSGNILDLGVWLGGILWVMMVGMVVAVGVKALAKVDSILPGNQTPNMAPYKQEVNAGPQYTIL